jgi:RNA polymerase sigma-70 factor (ECF subfamily)
MTAVTPEILARLLDEHGAALELFAAQWSESPADVVQEAFLQLVRQPALPERPSAWLYRVVRNGAVSSARSADRRRKHETLAARMAVAWPSDANETAIDAQAAAEALASLAVDLREVVVARIWGGLTFEEIAAMADISSSTAHRRYEAALNSLRSKLGVTWTETNHTIGR